MGSFSKTRRMSGWRLGYCVARPEITAGLRSVHERTTLGTPHPCSGARSRSARWTRPRWTRHVRSSRSAETWCAPGCAGPVSPCTPRRRLVHPRGNGRPRPEIVRARP
ncbi:aminotransferase class I/II-fold pyridoxal phosphate-dependent enzyme [Streptomyces sp. M10(2022)]